MARIEQPWNADGMTITRPMFGGLVELGELAVPPTLTVTVPGNRSEREGNWPDVTARFEIRNGAVTCTELRVASGPNDRPIRVDELQHFDLDGIARQAFGMAGMTREQPGVWALRQGGRPSREVREAVAAGRDVPWAELRAVARAYLAPEARRGPTVAVQKVLGYGSRETAGRRIREARQHGLIPAPGASEAELEAALAAIDERSENDGNAAR